MAGEEHFGFPTGDGDIKWAPMTRLWFDTYYVPSMSPVENVNQAEAAVSNGWQPISWPKEMADGA
jgi:hypothetical protein